MTAIECRRRLAPLFEQALRRRVFSAAALLAAEGERIHVEAVWGRCRVDGPAATLSTRFDLASMTKPLATTVAIMRLVSDRRLDLETPLEQLLPRGLVPADKRSIRIRQLLNHSSGLPAYRPYFRDLIAVPPKLRRTALVSRILAEPLENPPGRRTCYSDLGFLLLGILVEDSFAGALSAALEPATGGAAAISNPPGAPTAPLAYVPLRATYPPSLPARLEPPGIAEFAATEWCSWRNRLLVGEVHDENAYCLDGVAGHAGLFGTARAVHQQLRRLVSIYRGKLESPPVTDPNPNPDPDTDTVRRFWDRSASESPPESTRVLGFDTPSAQNSSAGRYFSPHSIGHLGFTGTSFWVDLDRDLTVVLLTNRVHPSRDNDRLQAFRPLLHDTVRECLHAT